MGRLVWEIRQVSFTKYSSRPCCFRAELADCCRCSIQPRSSSRGSLEEMGVMGSLMELVRNWVSRELEHTMELLGLARTNELLVLGRSSV